MAQNQGLLTFPGIERWDSFQITDISGISPSIGILRIFPQGSFPALNGDLVITYDDQDRGMQTVTFKNCQIDAASYEQGSGGQVVSVRIMDERWAWQYRSISGKYNYKAPNNFVNADHEKTARELATLCFEALGVEEFNVEALPDDARPEVDWDYENAASALAKLADDLGCRIVPKRSDGSWHLVVVGEGEDLPDTGTFPTEQIGSGIDPKELPDFLRVLPAPTKYQVALTLEPVVKDMDQSWKTLKTVSYAPNPDSPEGGFGVDHEGQADVSYYRIRQPDGSAISPQELALQTAFRCWRIDDNDGDGVEIPGYEDKDGNSLATRKQLILSDELVQIWTDNLGAEHARPAFIFGQFYSEIVEGDGNTVPGTRIDFQGQAYRESEEDRASFSMTLNDIDTDLSIISTSKPMLFANPNADALNISPFYAADLQLTCSVLVRDADTWEPVRYEYLQQIGEGSDKKFCFDIIKNDIQPWYVTTYNPDGTIHGTTDNRDEVDRQCKYYADAIMKTFETVLSDDRTYIGLYPIDMDGKIVQVSYSIGQGGATTRASAGTEHKFDIPSYADRRQRDGRHNIEEKLKLIKEITDRKIALRGTHNT